MRVPDLGAVPIVLLINCWERLPCCALVPQVQEVDDPVADLAKVYDIREHQARLGLEACIKKAVKKGGWAVITPSLRQRKQVVQGGAWGKARIAGEGGADGGIEGGLVW